MFKPGLKHGVTLSVLACLTNISVSLLTASWQVCSCNVRSESYRACHGRHRYGRILKARPGQARPGQAQAWAWAWEAHAGQARYGMVKAASE